MAESRIDPQRFDKLDATISRDIERRRKSRFVYLALLAAIGLIAALVVVRGLSTENEIKRAAEVAAATAANATASDTASAIANEVASEVASETVASANATLSQSVAAVTAEVEAVQNATQVLSDDLATQRATLQSLREEIVRPPAKPDDASEDALLAIAEEMALLRTQLQASEARQDGQFMEIRGSVSSLEKQVAANRNEIRRLSGEVARLGARSTIRSARSYLLRERAVNPLPDLGLFVELGRLSGDRLASFAFSDDSGTIATDHAGEVRIGEPFHVTDRAGRVFRATFGYVQTRLLIRDFVGLEMAMLRTADE